MKLIVTICLCSVLLVQLGRAQNETPVTEATKVSSSELPSPPTETSTDPVISSAIPVIPTSPVTEGTTLPTTTPPITNETHAKLVNKLSDQIRLIFNHFQEPSPIGFPGQTVLTDPMPLDNCTVELNLASGNFYNLTVHGLSNFTVEAANILLDEMQVYVMIHMSRVLIKGNLTMDTYFTKSKGPFNMTLINVTSEGVVSLKADAEGKLYASRSSTDMTYQELIFGSGGIGTTLQPLLDLAGQTIILDNKPRLLNRFDTLLTEEANKLLKNTPKIPHLSNMSPVDLAILEGRKYVRKSYEPYIIESFTNHESQYLSLKIGPVKIRGLSKFARVGNVTLQMREKVIQIIVRLITGRLTGTYGWTYDFGKVGMPQHGKSNFSINHIQFEVKINQSLDMKKAPILDDLQIEIGAVHLKTNSSVPFDYIVDMTAHLIPDLLRRFIVDALEEPIKQKIQTELLDKINVERSVMLMLFLEEN